MDNRTIDIYSEGEADFKLSITLAMSKHLNTTAIGYRIHDNSMVLYWVKSENMIPLPYPMGVAEIIPFVWGWLQKTKPKESAPDHDGDNGRGFRVFNEGWGHVFGDYRAFIAIAPIWALYGK